MADRLGPIDLDLNALPSTALRQSRHLPLPPGGVTRANLIHLANQLAPFKSTVVTAGPHHVARIERYQGSNHRRIRLPALQQLKYRLTRDSAAVAEMLARLSATELNHHCSLIWLVRRSVCVISASDGAESVVAVENSAKCFRHNPANLVAHPERREPRSAGYSHRRRSSSADRVR